MRWLPDRTIAHLRRVAEWPDLADTKEAAKYRVQYGSRLYNIKAVKNLADDMKTEGRSFQQLLCVEGESA